MREVAKLLHCLLQVAADLLEHGFCRVGVGVGDLEGEVHVHRERDEMLLRAVVEVALDRPSLRIAGFDDPHA